MNKILPIILVVVLSGCASSPKYYDRNSISWNELDECNLSVPECLASHIICEQNPKQCRFKPYTYVHECNDTEIQCKHEERQIEKKVERILNPPIYSERNERIDYINPYACSYTWFDWLMGRTNRCTPTTKSGYKKPVKKKNIDLAIPDEFKEKPTIIYVPRERNSESKIDLMDLEIWGQEREIRELQDRIEELEKKN